MTETFPIYCHGDLLVTKRRTIFWSTNNLLDPHQGFLPASTVLLVISKSDNLSFVLVNGRLGYVMHDCFQRAS